MNKEKIQKVIKLLKTYKFDAKEFYGIEDDEDINEAISIMQEELDKPLPEIVGQVGKTLVVNWFNKPNPGAYLYSSAPEQKHNIGTNK